MNAFNFGLWMKKVAADPLAAIKAQRVAQVKADRATAMQRQGLNANNPADLAKFKGGTTGPLMSSPRTTPATPSQPQSMLSAQRRPAPTLLQSLPLGNAAPKTPTTSMNMTSMPDSYTPPPKPNVTTTPVNSQALAKQVQQMPQQPAPQPAASTAGSWANQTNDPSAPQPQTPQGPTMFQRMTNAYNAFRGATPGATAQPAAPAAAPAQPSHIITTDNGRQFDTINKRFLDGRPGGFAR